MEIISRAPTSDARSHMPGGLVMDDDVPVCSESTIDSGESKLQRIINEAAARQKTSDDMFVIHLDEIVDLMGETNKSNALRTLRRNSTMVAGAFTTPNVPIISD